MGPLIGASATRWAWIGAAIAFVFVVEQIGIAAGAPLDFLVLDTVGAALFIVAGAVAWQRRPSSRSGPILVACSVMWSIGSLGPTGFVPWWVIGFALTGYYDVALAYLALTFPSERLSRAGRAAVAVMAIAFVVRSAGRLLLQDPARTYPELGGGPPNPFAVLESRQAFETVEVVASTVIAIAAVVVLGLALRRLRYGPELARALVRPVLVASVIALVSAAYSAAENAWAVGTGTPLVALPDALSGVFSWLLFGARALVPLGFLVAALRMRAPDGPLGAVAARLETDAAPDEVDAALRAYIENDQLADQLSSQLAELRASRARLVAAGDAERQRIERTLHDGAQQHLTAVAIRLDEARSLADGQPRLAAKLAETAAELQEAMQELRELARGIHPAILTDAGLEPALATLGRRSTVPVELAVELDGRLPLALEATAYYVVAEALTNVVRSARATRATVRIAGAGDGLAITVTDDGVGGADPSRGSGLLGMQDRVRALGGRLRIESPPGGGTRLEAWLPCG